MNKWYMKLFRRLLNTSILNAMIFTIQLIQGLFVKYANAVELKVPGLHLSDNTVPRLTERYFIHKISPTATKPRPQRWCVVCQKRMKRKDTVYWCDVCGMELCIEYFQDYHSQLNF
jgi:hypothetical protein